MGAANLLASSDQDVDFFIHGVFSYELFGQTFWITTTHCPQPAEIRAYQRKPLDSDLGRSLA